MILANSTAHTIHIRWFSGRDQLVELEPQDDKGRKLLMRVGALRALQMADFAISAGGLPTRILKIIKSEEFVDIKVESLAIPDHHLDNSELLISLFRMCNLHSVEHTDIKSKHVGDTIRTLVRCWI